MFRLLCGIVLAVGFLTCNANGAIIVPVERHMRASIGAEPPPPEVVVGAAYGTQTTKAEGGIQYMSRYCQSSIDISTALEQNGAEIRFDSSNDYTECRWGLCSGEASITFEVTTSTWFRLGWEANGMVAGTISFPRQQDGSQGNEVWPFDAWYRENDDFYLFFFTPPGQYTVSVSYHDTYKAGTGYGGHLGLTMTPVPEPTMTVLLPFLGLAARRRR